MYSEIFSDDCGINYFRYCCVMCNWWNSVYCALFTKGRRITQVCGPVGRGTRLWSGGSGFESRLPDYLKIKSMTKLEQLIENYKAHTPRDFTFYAEVIHIINNVYASVCTLPEIEVLDDQTDVSSHQFKAVINLKNYENVQFDANANARVQLVQLLSAYLGNEVRTLIDKSPKPMYIYNPLVISYEEHFIRFAITYT